MKNAGVHTVLQKLFLNPEDDTDDSFLTNHPEITDFYKLLICFFDLFVKGNEFNQQDMIQNID
jgi:hypothetical protein